MIQNTVEDSAMLPPLTEAEQEQMLVAWNATQVTYPKEQSIPRLFEAQVAYTPEAVALIFEGQELTYRQLNERANQLAHHLRQLGVESEVRVGLCVERSLEMVIGLLGILKAGGAYVPLDPAYPTERLAFMLQDAETTVLVTQQRLRENLPAHEHAVYLDTHWQAIARQSKENLASSITGENLAYVMYTSGSTGQPKGVLGTHRAALNRFHWMWTTYPFALGEVCCQKTALSFVDSVWEIFGPLLQGIRNVIIPDMVVKHPSDLLRTLEMYAVNRIVLVPSLLRALLDAATDLHPVLPDLKYCISSGEALPLELALRFMRSMPHSTLLNLYGSSEVAADATCYDMRNYTDTLSCIPIGRPIANIQIYLLDERMQLVPIGVPGELYVGGDGLARGYFKRPQLTTEKFIPHPFIGTRLYKTGDLARYLPDGNIEYLGRLDHQVKIRGFRIELGEIEAVLGQHPAVREAVVVAHEDTAGEKRLVAYVVFHKGQTATIRDLRDHLMQDLPVHMLPSTFIWLEALPLTPNGKVDRRALPVPDSVGESPGDLDSYLSTAFPAGGVLRETFVAPTSMLHHQLREIWEELLEVRPIGIRDNFFYVGGHSLLAARLIDRIKQVFGKQLSLATLFAAPTIEQLAQALQSEYATGVPASDAPSMTQPDKPTARAPLVAVQASGTRRPFFYLHGAWDSDAFYCFHLAQHLGPDQPFYALAPYNFDDSQAIPTVQEMATAHIQSLRTVQPEGPYLLGGFCNGGLVAYEMARQLHAAGQRVDVLVLIEPAYPSHLHRLARAFVDQIGALLRLSQEQQLVCFLRLRHLYKYVRHQRTAENIKAFRRIDPSILTLLPTADALRQDDNALLDWIITHYNYDPYSGEITLIWPREESYRGVWRHKAAQEQNIELRVIPGTHIGCRTEHIQTLADELGRCLSRAQTTPGAELEESRHGENIPV